MDKQELTETGTEYETQLTAEETLANTIVNRLITQGLLPESLAEETFYGLSEGKLLESDWRLLAEKALAKEAGGERDEG